METRTFFSDETAYYRTPAEPDPGDIVRIRFRTGRYQADKVSLLCVEKSIRKEPEKSTEEDTETESKKARRHPDIISETTMTWECEHHNFDFYSADLQVKDETVCYCFGITVGIEPFIYDKLGVWDYERELHPFMIDPGYHTPAWSKGCLYYQIFPDRFFNSDSANDVQDAQYLYNGKPVIRSDWGDPVLEETYRQFYGGDLWGIMEKLPYLQGLGVEAIYLNPVFASPSSHKYDCCDYDHVDMGLGVADDEAASDEVLSKLVKAAHRHGIRIVLDGVFNHCSSAHRWFGRNRRFESTENEQGAYGNPKSPYHDRFTFYDKGCRRYEAWWGVATLPKLNYEGDPALTQDICRIGRKWVSSPYNADGWRLDVGADLGHSEEANHAIWKAFHSEVRSARKDAVIFAEHYGDPSPWLKHDEWDGIMNYNAFMDPVSYFFTGMEKHSDISHPELKGDAEVFAETLRFHSAQFPANALFSSLNQLDNHDHSRFLTRTSGKTGRVETEGTYAAGTDTDPGILRQAAGFMYFWPGCPGLYYGDEVGLCGFTDPDNRRCFPWRSYDKELLWYFQSLGKLRKEYSFIKTASTKIIYAKDGVLAYSRFTDKQAVTVVVSQSDQEQEIELPMWMTLYPGYEENRVIQRIANSDAKGYSFDKRPYIIHYGLLKTEISPKELLVFS